MVDGGSASDALEYGAGSVNAPSGVGDTAGESTKVDGGSASGVPISLERAWKNARMSFESDKPISIMSVACKTSTPLPVTLWLRNNNAKSSRLLHFSHLETSSSSNLASAALPSSNLCQFASDKAHMKSNAIPKLGNDNCSIKTLAVSDRICSGTIHDVSKTSLYTASVVSSIQRRSSSMLGLS